MKKIAIINGINLGKGILGTREVNIYGCLSFDEYFVGLEKRFPQMELRYFQSDELAQIVGFLHDCKDYDGIVLNPGAYTHTSLVLADTIKAIPAPVVEVHISNLFAREQFRRNSLIASACVGLISGFGLKGYDMAIFSFSH